MTEQEKLREAIKNARALIWDAERPLGARITKPMNSADLAALVAAAESTLPKTKMVEVWRLEWSIRMFGEWAPLSDNYKTKEAANAQAEKFRADDNARCIRVTGPHQQEVPA